MTQKKLHYMFMGYVVELTAALDAAGWLYASSPTQVMLGSGGWAVGATWSCRCRGIDGHHLVIHVSSSPDHDGEQTFEPVPMAFIVKLRLGDGFVSLPLEVNTLRPYDAEATPERVEQMFVRPLRDAIKKRIDELRSDMAFIESLLSNTERTHDQS